MAHHVQFREDWGCVHLVHTGDLDIDDAYASRYAVRDLLVANNCRKVLVNIQQANPQLTEDERGRFFQSHRNLLPLGVRIAMVVDAHLLSNKVAVEKLSMIPGILQRLFSDDVGALEWLLDS